MYVKTSIAILICSTMATPIFAAHANPWMEDGDSVLMQYHEENLAQSVDTPGEDEMNGTQVGSAHGKIDLDAGQEDGEGLANGHAGGGAYGGGKGGRP